MLLAVKRAFYFFVFNLYYVNALLVVDLGGNWNVRTRYNAYESNAIVPGGIYSDLMNSGIIEDIFFNFNDRTTQWVASEKWIYSRNFTVTQEFLNHDTINIHFDGVDTFATVYINDNKIGSTNNMFVRYIFSIKTRLLNTVNTVSVKFDSPVLVAITLFGKQAANYTVPPVCVPEQYHGFCHVNHIRKMQASFGWDWGPGFPSTGIWKPVHLEAYNTTAVRDVTVDIKLNNKLQTWDIEVTTYLAQTMKNTITGSIMIQLHTDLQTYQEVYSVNVSENENGEFVNVQQFSIPELSVKLWWPNGYGNAELYQMKVMFVNEEETEKSAKTFKVGFRTIELIQNEIAEGAGATFYFVVNNIPIFAKGANTIPIHILPEKGQNSTTIRFLLESAKKVHMNMLRVWGGGVYESDSFYETADELGILIWQDFMFACSMYPTNEEYLSTVKEEVKHQVRRLQHHASIALWAANNENEAALRQNWYGTAGRFKLYKADYVKLYVDTIRVEVLKSDTSRQFLTSSPTNGIKSEEDGYVAANPYSKMYGDVHFYNYFGNSWDQNIFPIPRFSSEYGYQSLPSLSTLLTATDDVSNLRYGSSFMDSRQHHPGGYAEMKLLTEQQLTLPKEKKDNFSKTFIFYSQIIQAMAYKQQTEYYRLCRSSLNSVGEGFTMGALYWQLNDVWVAPTWSSIDYENNWKMLHYYAKNFFAPVIITSHLKSDRNVNLLAVSDLMTNIYNATAKVFVYRWDSFEPMYVEAFSVNLLAGVSNNITSFWIDKYLSDNGCGTLAQTQNTCFVYLTLEDDRGDKIAPDNQIFSGPLKSINLKKGGEVHISAIRTSRINGESFEVDVRVNKVSLFVWLESTHIRGLFSENGFLQVNETKTVYFYPELATTLAAVNASITVTHLLDSQYL